MATPTPKKTPPTVETPETPPTKGHRRRPSLEGMDSRQKFQATAVPRVKATIVKIRSIGRLGSVSTLAPTPEDVTHLFAQLREELDRAEAKFGPQVSDNEVHFSF